MFYQFCDLEVKEAQDLISISLKRGDNAVCDEKNGWYAPGTDQKLRDILVREINQQLENENMTPANEDDEDEEDQDSNTSGTDSEDDAV